MLTHKNMEYIFISSIKQKTNVHLEEYSDMMGQGNHQICKLQDDMKRMKPTSLFFITTSEKKTSENQKCQHN